MISVGSFYFRFFCYKPLYFVGALAKTFLGLCYDNVIVSGIS